MVLSYPPVFILKSDPDLGHRLAPDELAAAAGQAKARLLTVPVGEWSTWSALSGPAGFGFLVLRGVMIRATTLLGRTSMELVGREDLVRPWEELDDSMSVSWQTSWTALSEVRLAVLDEQFADRIAPWPAISAALVARASLRARWLGFQAAMLENPRVDVRLLLLFWHMADRWGRVGRDGVAVPVHLTHRLLGRLVRAQRPTVTASLRKLEARQMLNRNEAGTWILRGDADAQLRRLNAGS